MSWSCLDLKYRDSQSHLGLLQNFVTCLVSISSQMKNCETVSCGSCLFCFFFTQSNHCPKNFFASAFYRFDPPTMESSGLVVGKYPSHQHQYLSQVSYIDNPLLNNLLTSLLHTPSLPILASNARPNNNDCSASHKCCGN